MSLDLDSGVARRIIETVGTHGVPPEYGFQYFTAGLDPYLSVIEKEYLASFIREGGSAFKMVVGAYGGGRPISSTASATSPGSTTLSSPMFA
jgi:hypothetical protein